METMTAGGPAQSLNLRPDGPTLRLDKTKKFSTVHGECTPEDPHYKVRFWQNDLPFGVDGLLIHDDGKRQPYSGQDAESKPVQFRPLYDDRRSDKARRALDRLSRQQVSYPEPDDVDREDEVSQAAVKAAAAEMVNFESWLRGEANYEFWQLQVAFESRYSRKTHKESQMVVELVIDEKVVTEDQVAPRLRRHLEAFDKGM